MKKCNFIQREEDIVENNSEKWVITTTSDGGKEYIVYTSINKHKTDNDIINCY